jgi:Uma2 family endonuclease
MHLQRSSAKRPATYQDVLDAPPNMIAEIIRGALHLQPRSASPHSFAGSSLGDELTSPFQKGRGGPGGWWIVDEPELHLGEDIFVPDLAGWRRERMPRFPRVSYFTQSPDWVCEILSPSTRNRDRIDKRELYGEHGVTWMWLVDPDDRTLEAFARRAEGWLLLGMLDGDTEVRLAPFDAVGFPLTALWPDDEQVADDQQQDS